MLDVQHIKACRLGHGQLAIVGGDEPHAHCTMSGRDVKQVQAAGEELRGAGPGERARVREQPLVSGTAFGEAPKAQPSAYRTLRITNPETSETMVIRWGKAEPPSNREIEHMFLKRRADDLERIAASGKVDIPWYQRAAAAVPEPASALFAIVIAASVIALWLLTYGLRFLWQRRAALLAALKRSAIPVAVRFGAVYLLYLSLMIPVARDPRAAVLLGVPFSLCIAYAWQRLLSKSGICRKP